MNARQQCHNEQIFKEETSELASIHFVELDMTRVAVRSNCYMFCNYKYLYIQKHSS